MRGHFTRVGNADFLGFSGPVSRKCRKRRRMMGPWGPRCSLLLLVVLQCSIAALGLYGPSSDVVQLSPANFKSKVFFARPAFVSICVGVVFCRLLILVGIGCGVYFLCEEILLCLCIFWFWFIFMLCFGSLCWALRRLCVEVGSAIRESALES